MKKILITIFILTLFVITACSSVPVADEKTGETTPSENINTRPLDENTVQIVDENITVDIGDII